MEDLLRDFVERERLRRRAEDTALDHVIDGIEEHHLAPRFTVTAST